MVSVSGLYSQKRQRRWRWKIPSAIINVVFLGTIASAGTFLLIWMMKPKNNFLPNESQEEKQLYVHTDPVSSSTGLGEANKRRGGHRTSPTHAACANDSVQGIYHISMGDIGGAAGTIFYQFVIAQILYAEQQGLKPWVFLSNVSHVVYDPDVHQLVGGTGVTITARTGRNATYQKRNGGHHRDATPGPLNPSLPVRTQTLSFPGTGVWDHYFLPVSDFVPGDRSCTSKLYVTMDLYLITPGLHGYAEYAPRCWRYKYMPDYMTKPHLGITEWLEPQRKRAHDVIKRYIHPHPYLKAAAVKVNPDCSLVNPCLGLHIRHSDKASGRRIVETSEFLPYAQEFVRSALASDTIPHIYLATDSTLVLQEIMTTWPIEVRQTVRTAGGNVMRSNSNVAVFDLDSAKQHHRANQEVLIEILALSACQFLVHGFSAVSESAVWTGLHLHKQSVNLEDIDHLSLEKFGQLVIMVLTGVSQRDWPRPVYSVDVWPELYNTTRYNDANHLASKSGCDGYSGVLLISSVGRTASAAAGLFTGIINQLIYAEKYNLKPWVHLSSDDAMNSYLYDKTAHSGSRVDFEMMSGMVASQTQLDKAHLSMIVPGIPTKVEGDLSSKVFVVDGNGIWRSYFDPVSDFHPGDGDESCRNVPLFEIGDERMVVGLNSFARWSVRAWRYDKVPSSLWWGPNMTSSLSAWYRPMRERGSQILQKYYRFQPYIVSRANQVNPVVPGQPCLGLHLRNGDKWGMFRSKIGPSLFEEYVDAFVRAGGQCIYVATDSHRALNFVLKTFPERLTMLMRSQGAKIVRSTKLDWPSHYLENHHRVNGEVLVDILALSKCQLLLHGFSTTSEAAIYLNPKLHENSVNLEDPGRITASDFEIVSKRVVASGVKS